MNFLENAALAVMIATGISACTSTAKDKPAESPYKRNMEKQLYVEFDGKTMTVMNDKEIGVDESGNSTSKFILGSADYNERKTVYNSEDSSVVVLFSRTAYGGSTLLGGGPRNYNDFTKSEKTEFTRVVALRQKMLEAQP